MFSPDKPLVLLLTPPKNRNQYPLPFLSRLLLYSLLSALLDAQETERQATIMLRSTRNWYLLFNSIRFDSVLDLQVLRMQFDNDNYDSLFNCWLLLIVVDVTAFCSPHTHKQTNKPYQPNILWDLWGSTTKHTENRNQNSTSRVQWNTTYCWTCTPSKPNKKPHETNKQTYIYYIHMDNYILYIDTRLALNRIYV